MSSEPHIRRLWLVYLLCDTAAIVAAYFTGLHLRLHSIWGKRLFGELNNLLGVSEPADLGSSLQLFYAESAPRIILIMTVVICFLYGSFNLYAGRRYLLKRPIGWNIIAANAAALALFYCYFYARRNMFHPRTMFITILFLNTVFCIGARSFLYRGLQWLRRFGIDRRKAVLVGGGRDADTLEKYIEMVHPHGIHVVERLVAKHEAPEREFLQGIENAVRRHASDMVICAEPDFELGRMMEIVALCDRLRISAHVLSYKLDVLLTQAKLSTDVLRGMPLVHFAEPAESDIALKLKHALAVVFSCIALAALLPFLLLIAAFVRLTSAGPSIFLQERVGKNREPFRMLKFRTMRHLADELQAEMEEYNESGAVLFKMRKDPRVTLAGRLLRRFSIDELPQLLNVIRGQMTLIGPRPLPRRDFENYHENWQYLRHSRLPGLTGLWQVSGRSEIGFPNMCILDIYYARNGGWISDLKILIKTIWVVLFAKGAY